MLSKDYLCGVGGLRPGWLQPFASPRVYALVYAVFGIFQGSYRSYLVGTLSTVEKRFSMSSKQCSIIMIGDDISPIIGCFVIMFFMKNSSRPPWITLGMVASAIGCVASMLPFFLYGPATHFGTPQTNANETSVGVNASNAAAAPVELCGPGRYENPRCSSQHNDGSMSVIPLWSLFLGNFFNGVGATSYYVLGTSYLDDNVKKKNSALYLGAVYFVRMMGPILGFTLSSRALRQWENPSGSSGGLTPKDPRWIGAWWMGYIVIGISMCLMAVPMMLFPKKLRSKSEANKREHKKAESLAGDIREAFAVIVRVVRTPVYSFRLLGFIAGYIALAGYYINFPKYLEHQFQRTASQASAITAPVYLVSNTVGIAIGGAFTHFVKPRPRSVALHCVLAYLVATIGFYALSGIECQVPKTLVSPCSDCDCSTALHSPVCEVESRRQFFSPCFAGCTQAGNGSFFDCSCVTETTSDKLSRLTFGGYPMNVRPSEVSAGRCQAECESPLLTYSLIVFCIQVTLASTYVGGNLLLLRSILPQDKSVALAFQSTCLNLFAFMPYPIIFSYVMDRSCDVWENKCGGTGACWLYNLPKMRTWIHGISSVLLLICTGFQVLVYIFSGSIKNFYEDPEDRKQGHEIKDTHFDKSSKAHAKRNLNKHNTTSTVITKEIRSLHPSLLNIADPEAEMMLSTPAETPASAPSHETIGLNGETSLVDQNGSREERQYITASENHPR